MWERFDETLNLITYRTDGGMGGGGGEMKSVCVPVVQNFKGTVRPDWICMRVVSLENPLKGHQPLYVINFFFLILNI